MFSKQKYINKYENALEKGKLSDDWKVYFDATTLNREQLKAHFISIEQVRNPAGIIEGVILSCKNNQHLGPQLIVYANGQQLSYEAFGDYRDYKPGMFVRLTLCKNSSPLKIEIGIC